MRLKEHVDAERFIPIHKYGLNSEPIVYIGRFKRYFSNRFET